MRLKSWLVADFNPTTILTGNNVLPATIANPETGEIDDIPSSSPQFLITASRMGLHLLPQLARQAGLTNGELFSDRTLRAIQEGDVHVTRSQWAAYLPAAVRAFLQLLVVLYDQTIAHKQGIIQLAEHLRLTFKRFPPEAARALTGVMLQKKQGNKKQYSISFYDKAVEVARMRQGRTLTRLEAAIIRRHVRLDMTVHSAGVLTLIGEPRRRLPRLLQKRPNYLDAKSAQRFLTEEPRPTVWWLERAVWILAHTTTDFSRQSFGSWLIPEMLREVLRLDSIAGFTSAGLDAVWQQQGDKVVAAWRQTERVEDDWAGALAQAAGCSKGWVYERRKKLLAKYKIDIARPFAFYRDLVFYGPNSLIKPKDRAALNTALARGDAATNLRLRRQAAKVFDRRRIDVVGGTVRAPPLLMSPKVAIEPKAVAHDQPDAQSVAPAEPDVDAVLARGSVGAKGNSPGALNLRGDTHAGARGQGADARPATPAKPVTNPSQGQEVRRPAPHRPVQPPSSGRASVSLPPPPTGRIVLLRRTPPPPLPPPTGRIVLLRRTPPPPPPPTGRIVLLRRTPPPPLPPPTGRIVLKVNRRPPPLPLPTGRIVLKVNRRPPPLPLPTGRIVLLRHPAAFNDPSGPPPISELA